MSEKVPSETSEIPIGFGRTDTIRTDTILTRKKNHTPKHTKKIFWYKINTMNTEAFIQVSIRLKAEDVAKIDAAAHIESDRTCYNITRTDFCRAAILKAAQDVLDASKKKGGK